MQRTPVQRAGIQRAGAPATSVTAALTLALALALGLTACATAEQVITGVGTGPRVSLTPVSATIPTGGTVQLKASATDVNGRPLPLIRFVYFSSDTAIAAVSPSGLVSGRRPGGVTLTAVSDQGPVASIPVLVTAVPAPVRVRLGRADAQAVRTGPAWLLQGSGSPTPAAVSRLVTALGGAPIDVVVLSASLPTSGSTTPECNVMIDVANVNSCETITITERSGADDPFVRIAINAAELVYFAGGDQCRYVEWAGSSLMTGVRNVIARGGAVGGGSAGLAIQGEFVHDGCTGSPTSATALRNPFAATISLSSGLFTWTPFAGVITDSHFVTRDRLGRLLSFVSRLATERSRQSVWGLGIEDGAAVVVDRVGEGTFVGGPAYVVRSAESAVASPGIALDARGFRVRRFVPGDSWSFVSRPLDGFWSLDVRNGVLQGSGYSP